MPHVLVNLRLGTLEAHKSHLAERIAQDVTDVLNDGDESVSDALEAISERDWAEKVYEPES